MSVGYKMSVGHNEPMASSEHIKDVTFEELARYVIDDKPISRIENKTITKYYTKEDSHGEKHCNGCCH